MLSLDCQEHHDVSGAQKSKQTSLAERDHWCKTGNKKSKKWYTKSFDANCEGKKPIKPITQEQRCYKFFMSKQAFSKCFRMDLRLPGCSTRLQYVFAMCWLFLQLCRDFGVGFAFPAWLVWFVGPMYTRLIFLYLSPACVKLVESQNILQEAWNLSGKQGSQASSLSDKRLLGCALADIKMQGTACGTKPIIPNWRVCTLPRPRVQWTTFWMPHDA